MNVALREEQRHDTHVVIPVVVLCTTGSRLDLVRRLKLVEVLYRNTEMRKEARGR